MNYKGDSTPLRNSANTLRNLREKTKSNPLSTIRNLKYYTTTHTENTKSIINYKLMKYQVDSTSLRNSANTLRNLREKTKSNQSSAISHSQSVRHF